MMIPVPSVDAGSTGPLTNSVSSLNRRTDAPLAGPTGRPTPLPAAGMFDNSQAMMQLEVTLSRLLQDIGGGVENDKVVQMLSALIILLLLLETLRDSTDSEYTALSQLAAGRGSPPRFVEVYSSSSTIMIAHTATTRVVGTMDDPVVSFGSGQPEPQGRQIDLSA